VQGAFVTLKKGGDLRGCIGLIIGDRPLAQVVGAMAYAAAFRDPRFEPLGGSELSQIEIELSVLTPPKNIARPDAIVVGRDGVILRKGGRSAVFLPQVATEQGWSRDELLDNLAVKAGLPPNAWRQGADLSVFQAEVFSEKDMKK
jgi:AmmeMemoRadiSam system protein A